MLDSTRREEHARSRKQGNAPSTLKSRKPTDKEQKSDGVEPESRMQWTVKGIDKETLEASRVAARKRGMKFGAWVNEVLRAAATDDSHVPSTTQKELLEKIAEIEFKLDQSVGELRQQNNHIQHDVRVLHMLVPKAAAAG